MTDLYTQIANNPLGKLVVKNAGLPQPVQLERYMPGQPLVTGKVLLGSAPGGGGLAVQAARALDSMGADTGEGETFKAIVYDASGIETTAQLSELHRFFSAVIRRVQPSGRVVVLGTDVDTTAQRALEGFVRSVGKEVRKGATAQLVRVEPGAEEGMESTLRFLLSPKSAYVSGQVIRIGAGDVSEPADWARPLDGMTALVTGASRGIGASIAAVLERDGAHVVGLDVPGSAGVEIELDITADDAPEQIAKHFKGGVDIVVHNAGITRDKTLGRMTPELWDQVIAVNLIAPERITERLLAEKVLGEGGRVIGVSSISGIAGNAGQTNYATSKAGVIGLVESQAPVLAVAGATINAVAPGFIETAMTAAMPVTVREAGRRMNSLRQGGLPVDVAEAVAWLASPGSGAINGNVIRVCGQSLIGA